MALDTKFNLRLGEDENAVIEAEREKLAAQGIKASTAQIIRSLIFQASTKADTPNGGARLMISEKFKLTG